MRRFAGLVAVTALALALASPALAEYGSLDDPDDPARAYLLYHVAGPEYGRRTVWHPDALRTQARAVIERSADRPDRAIVLLYGPGSDDEDEPMVFGVQRHGDEWRIYGMIPADDADPWTIFAPLLGG